MLTEPKRKELFESIVEAIAEMPDLPRRVFVLSHYKGLPEEEIAARIGAKKEEVPSLLSRANNLFVEKLRSLVQPEPQATPPQGKPRSPRATA